ncbi:hypothetical protein KAX97_00550 [candidate division WOR-3 bacterium]|nr:hypothetical protein [candidate division WOR-3 bacterium]
MTGILILVFIGLFLWLVNLQVLILSRDWPLILVFAGLINVLNMLKENKQHTIIDDLEIGKITVKEAEEKLKKTH